MPTRRKPLVLTAALAVLLTSAATVLLLRSQPPNGHRQPVTAIPVTPRSPRDHASTPLLLDVTGGLVTIAAASTIGVAVVTLRWPAPQRVTPPASAGAPAGAAAGAAAATERLSAEDGYGSRYGLVRDRRTGLLTATLRVIPASTWLAEPGEVDGWVATWGAGLASLGYLPALRWVTVTVDTAPDPAAPSPARSPPPSTRPPPGRRCTSWTSWWPPPRRPPPTWTPGSASPSTPPPSPPGREPPPRRSPKWGARCPGWNQRSAPAASPCSLAPGPPGCPDVRRGS
ncbi:MAG TPA: SCO6880 family protein [Streptosporangiaceae bacterium]|nr:SCO6880 family protein [Streptosporangiaceae bacterium]